MRLASNHFIKSDSKMLRKCMPTSDTVAVENLQIVSVVDDDVVGAEAAESEESYELNGCESEVFLIENESETENLIKDSKDNKYVDLYTPSLQNVTLGRCMSSKSELKRLAKFYTANKMSPIKNLRFDGWSRGLMEDHGRLIASIVAEVESFTLSNSTVIGDLHECILKHLPEMKRFTLWRKKRINAPMSYQWLQNQYPNLEYFAWHTNDVLPIDLAKYFFEINPGIRFFSIQSKSQITLKQLIEQDICVNELFFTVTGDPRIFTDLQNLCVQKDTRLHLKFPDAARTVLAQNIVQFSQLAQYIDGLYFEHYDITDNLAQTLTKFENLKVLQFNFSMNAQILSNIPTLQEIYAYWGITSQNFSAYREAMMIYASRLSNLKRIYMRNNSQKFEKFKFDEMNAARIRLIGACKLKIHFRTDEQSVVCALNDIQRDYDTIGIGRVENVEVNNPLVTEYLIGKKINEFNIDRFIQKCKFCSCW